MCGIAGYIGDIEVDKELILSLIRHRGPDQEGSYRDRKVQLFQTRLSILDLSLSGQQPMISQDGNYVLVYNGEIYNHLDLRKELLIKGYNFLSTSDTETLLYGLIEWGTSWLHRLNGIFAFAFYNKEKEQLLLARDHFGVKPLYFSLDDSQLTFSSELKVIQAIIQANELYAPALFNYVNFLWSPGEATPFAGIKKVLPGHYVELSNVHHELQVKQKRYYQLPFNGQYPISDEKRAIEMLDEALQKAVSRQLLSDVPVGFFLSGGLDSSLIVAIAQKITGKKLQCFTIDAGFAETTQEGFKDDLYYAQAVAKHLNVDLEIVKADIDIIRDFDKMIWHLDEPQADAAPLNVLNISRRARAMGFKVLIGGTAGDDLFTGYRRHQAIQIEKFLQWIPLPLGRLLQRIPFSSVSPWQRRLKKVVAQLHQSTAQRLANYFEWLPGDRVLTLFSPQFQKELGNYRATDFLQQKLEEIPQENSWINRMLYWEFSSFLVDQNLNYTDKMGMAEGIEIRVPYLDIDLVQLSTQIHPKLKLKGQETKYILKKVAERYLPKSVIYRPKTGFGAPVRQWITKDMQSMIAERLSKKRLEEMGIFNAKEVWQLINDNVEGKIDASYSIWALLAIDSWHTQFEKKKTYLIS